VANERSAVSRRISVRVYVSAVVFAVVATVGLTSAEAAPVWRTRGYEMVQTHAHGFFEGTRMSGSTGRDPTKVRFEVQWTARDDRRASLRIIWAIGCFSEDGGREWYRQGDFAVRIRDGGKVIRTIDARLSSCTLSVDSSAERPIPAGRLEVWVKELS
jgi:hypothetical protein